MRVLVTGFGAFPNAPDNPTARLVVDLRRARRHFAQRGITLQTLILPVRFGASAQLDAAIHAMHPQVLLHFGLAARRSTLTIETRAANRAGVLHPDACGRPAPHRQLVPNGPAFRRVRFPVPHAVASLRAAGIACRASVDAGDYICNETLFHSLASDVPCVGFIHVPRLHRPERCDGRLSRTTLMQAAVLMIGTLAPYARARTCST